MFTEYKKIEAITYKGYDISVGTTSKNNYVISYGSHKMTYIYHTKRQAMNLFINKLTEKK